jgi:signal transduction histidine kinase
MLQLLPDGVSYSHQQGRMKMTNEQAKAIFNKAIETAKSADQVARLEVCREYFTNPDFRKKLEDYVWELNK